jgi:hypothetical protein
VPYIYTCGKETTTQETDPVSVPPPAYFSFVNSHNEPSAQTKPDAEETTITAKNKNKNKTEDVELGQSEDGLESVKEFRKRQIHTTILVVVGTPIALDTGLLPRLRPGSLRLFHGVLDTDPDQRAHRHHGRDHVVLLFRLPFWAMLMVPKSSEMLKSWHLTEFNSSPLKLHGWIRLLTKGDCSLYTNEGICAFDVLLFCRHRTRLVHDFLSKRDSFLSVCP